MSSGNRMTPNARVLLRQLREVMAEESNAQTRLDHLVEAIARNMVADVCSIYVRRADDVLELFATKGLHRDAVHKTRLPWGTGLVGKVAREGRPLNIKRAHEHPDFAFRPETGEDKLNAFLGAPIVRSGKTIGVLTIQNNSPLGYSEEETEAAQMVSTILAEIISSERFLTESEVQEVEDLVHGPEYQAGTAIVQGIVQGTAYLLTPKRSSGSIFAKDLAEERKRLQDALSELQRSVDDMMARDRALSHISREVLEVYRLFAYDRGWARRLEEKILAGLNAEAAVEQVQAENKAQMRAASDPYLRERLHDLDDLSRRLLRTLRGESSAYELPENAVVLAETLGPAELLELDRSKLVGLVLAESSSNSHAAVVARSLRVPMVSGVETIIDAADDGDDIIVDGTSGEVSLRPTSDAIATFEEKARIRSEQLEMYQRTKDKPCVTKDGTTIRVDMNAGLVMDMAMMDEVSADGVGLFRTELQFLVGRTLPTVKEQAETYESVIDAAAGARVVFRTADLGSDKRAHYMHGPLEANPAMGWRGLRMAIDREGLLRMQLRALMDGAKGRPLTVLLPLVTSAEEVIQARAIIDKEIDRARKLEEPVPESVEIGVMIEIPAAAMSVQRIGQHADFMSIGGNDLAQFFFAADRENDRVASRYDYLSRSFVSLLKRIADDAREAGVPVSYCGEQAGDPLMALALVAIGFTHVSVAASAVLPFKDMMRHVDRTVLAEAMETWLTEVGGVPLRSLVHEFAQDHDIPTLRAY
ncbi:MAG: phosphoenolpyruvate--protein phosphotransferase [Parvularculaceae bacterium]|nr:phosphoenolpyruvate--protein phosphotransferase [Parvularculaceae bacterium]